jgi:hypothetical protein
MRPRYPRDINFELEEDMREGIEFRSKGSEVHWPEVLNGIPV